MENVKPYYAVKCNPDNTLLKWLKKYDVNFDCASAREMAIVGCKGESIIFANPCKTQKDILLARRLNVPWVVVDSAEEYEKMDYVSYKPKTLLRIAVDDSASTSPFNVKFGLNVEKLEEVVYSAKKLQIPVVGLSFHVGSGCKNPSAFAEAIYTARTAWKDLNIGKMEVLDIGGGWSYKEDEFIKQAEYVSSALININTKVIAEPGRFFAAPTHSLYVQVIGKKPMHNAEGWRYTLDESIYGQFSCIPFDHAKPEFARICVSKEPARNKTKAIFFGRTCDSLDYIATSIETEELEVGDWLYIPNMGAYTTATSTEFNGFPKPSIYEFSETPEHLSWCTNMKFPLASMMNLDSIK